MDEQVDTSTEEQSHEGIDEQNVTHEDGVSKDDRTVWKQKKITKKTNEHSAIPEAEQQADTTQKIDNWLQTLLKLYNPKKVWQLSFY